MNEIPESPAPDAQMKPSFWARLKLHILHPELTPQQVAISFAIGLAISWNPLLGTHIGLVLGLCLLFRRLHRPLIFIAVFINNPWTMVPMATVSTYFGNLILGRGLNIDLSMVHWREIGWRSFTSQAGFETMYRMMKPVLVPYLVGGGVLTLLALPVGYFSILALTRRLRRLHLHMPHLHLPHFRHDDPKA
jgi:uncharacterized protein (DUF2062 family)